MHVDEIYELTALGRSELRRSATRLSAAELALLVRFNGELTLGQLQATLAPSVRVSFPALFRSLRDRRLLTLMTLDPLQSRFQIDLQNLGLHVGAAEADAGLAALRRSGFYVQIARERTDVPPPAPGQLRTAVVVEDEPVLANFIKHFLMLSGFQVRLAANRAEVVEAFRQLPVPQLVLLDVVLPDADGFDILLRLRQHAKLKRVPVIMLTAQSTRLAVIKGIAAGADGYLTKPFEPEALLRAVQTVLGDERPVSSDAANDPWVNPDALPDRASGP